MPVDMIKSIDRASATNGGNKWAYCLCNETGSLTGTWKEGAYRKSSELNFTTEYTPVEIESNEIINSTPGKVTAKITITSKQDDIETENFLKSADLNDSYYSIIMSAGESHSGVQKLRYFPITKIERNYNVSSPGREPVINVNVLHNEYDKFPSTVPTWVTIPSSSFVTPAGDYYIAVGQSGSKTL